MSRTKFHRPLTPEQKRMTDNQLVAELAPGTGLSIARFAPYWDVVLTYMGDYIVTDSSRPERKPLKVHGPVKKRAEAVEWARLTASLWRSTHVMGPEWPWE